MTAFGDQLDDDEIDAILAYIKTRWTDGQRDFPGEVTADQCDRS